MRLVTLTLLAASLLPVSVACAQQQPPFPPPPLPPRLGQELQALTDQPARHTGFVFDKNMMAFAQGVLEANGLDNTRAAAAITGISVDTYHYQQPAFYTPEALAAVNESYRAAGWKHFAKDSQTAANTAQPIKMVTDMWLHFSGTDVDAITVLTRGSRDMNVLQITGDLRPLDLLHLSGHFGIPKVAPNAVLVPAP